MTTICPYFLSSLQLILQIKKQNSNSKFYFIFTTKTFICHDLWMYSEIIYKNMHKAVRYSLLLF